MDTKYKLSLDHKIGSIFNQLAEEIFYPKVNMLSTVDIGWNFEVMPKKVTDQKVRRALKALPKEDSDRITGLLKRNFYLTSKSPFSDQLNDDISTYIKEFILDTMPLTNMFRHKWRWDFAVELSTIIYENEYDLDHYEGDSIDYRWAKETICNAKTAQKILSATK